MGWEDWLSGHLAERFAISVDQAARLVRDGKVLPLVDGVDEMDPAGEQESAQALVTALNTWMSGRGKAPVVVSCRHREYEVLVRGVDRATHIEMLPLTGREAAHYLQDQFLDRIRAFGGQVAADHKRAWSWHQVITDPEHKTAAAVTESRLLSIARGN